MTPTARSKGALIVLEGIDGAGKSTIARRLAARWRLQGYRVVRAKEPADPRLGRAALELASSDPWASATLFTLDRILARSSIEGALRSGAIVLQDRSYFSTIAYQGEQLSPALRSSLFGLQRRFALRPDRVIWLDLPTRAALSRVNRRGRNRAPVERQKFLEGVRRGYARLAVDPTWVRVDAQGSAAEVVDAADRALVRWIRRRVRPTRARE